GVFTHLEMLEARAHEAAVQQEEKEQEEEKLAGLKARVEELRLRRDELQAKVDLQQKGQLGKEGVVSDAAQPSARAVLEWKIKSVKAMLQVFYLTGNVSRFACVLPTAAFWGLLDVQRTGMPGWSGGWGHCTLRAASPTLMDSLPSFAFQKLSLSLQEHFSDQIEGTLQRNSLCNLLVFNYNVSSKSETFPFKVRLLYGDLSCSLPTEVVISCTPDAPASLAETAAAHSDLFRRVALHKAFRSFGRAEESGD
ncbi:CENPO protein, partial [Fregetta grallaria]|nr:CENPO protein [Fregetta grallaria]